MSAGVLEVARLSKSFGATRALKDVSFGVAPGRVHALVGENGAGKSTLLKIISGIHRPDAGTVEIDGLTLETGSTSAAQRAGIQIVHQELALMPDLTVAQNVYAGHYLRRRGLVDRRAMEDGAIAALERLGARIEPGRRVEGLSTANQQFVELARGLVRSARVLILDEPTAALPPEDADRLLAVLRELAADGVGVVYVSHRLEEVLAVADEVTVLKDGAIVSTRPASELTTSSTVALMVGRPMEDLFPDRAEVSASGPAALSVEGLIALPAVKGVDLEVRPGEIVGLYGLEGAGQDEVLAAIAGDLPRTAGSVAVAGRLLRRSGVSAAIDRGVGFVPPDRKQEGLVLDASGVANISLSTLRRRFTRALVVLRGTELEQCLGAAVQAGVHGDVRGPVGALSGGNQQKVLLARLLLAGSPVLLLNQPTRGVDVGAKADIYRLVRRVCADGRGALVASPEINELIGLCDRIVVIRDGRVAGDVPAAQASEESVLAMAVPS